MSYATSLIMAYPPPYGPSTLLSDDLVQRSTHGSFYEPSVPYMSSNRLYSDSLTHNPVNHGPTSYHPSIYSQYPSTNYRTSSIPDWHRDIPPQNPYGTINDMREYSDSLGTTSNTGTASSLAHSINDNNQKQNSMNVFHNYQQSYNRLLNDADRSPHRTTMRSPSRHRIPINDEKPASTHRSLPGPPAPIVQKQSPIQESRRDQTPVPSPSPPSSPPPAPPLMLTKQESNLQRNPTVVEIEKQPPAVDVETWLDENKDETPEEDKSAEQAWTVKIDQLHTIQAQREKEKTKPSRALPSISKKNENKPITNKSSTANDNKIRETSFQMRNNSYFDSLFDGNFFRKSSTNQQGLNSSYQRSLPPRNPSNQPKTTLFPKYVSPRRAPPPVQRAPPTITTTTWKNQRSKQNLSDSTTPRDSNHKDEDERYLDALHKFRSDRAEQQKTDSNESTAKRLNYGDYVRRSTKGVLLRNAIRPSPWSDFIDLKKGNLYSLTKEEKKDRYNQSKSYGERIRNRNFVLHQGAETARTLRRSTLLPVHDEEPQSDDEKSHEPINNDNDNDNDDDNDNESKSLKRPDSDSTIKTTNKTFTKQNDNGEMISNRSGRTTISTDHSSALRPSEEEDEDVSDFEFGRKQKKKLHMARYDSSARTTTATEESETDATSEQRSFRTKNRDTDDDLFTVREEKTLESFEGAHYKKR